MARKYNGGMEVGTGFDVQSNRPLDERDIVQTQIDLLVLENCYPGIEVKVEDESYVAYKWNGIDQSNIANWTIQTSGGGGTGDGDMLKSDYAFDNNTVKDSNQLNGQEASSYMTKSVYDPDGNNIVQNSEKLGGQNPAYYDQGQALTDHVDNTDVHLSTDERAAIDNSPNAPNAGNAFATQADLAAGGNGDMLISVYGGSDANTVRNSDTVDGLTGAEVDQRAHVANVTTNPHAVTKANVGLGNADNTSDLAKPISTATQAALDTKLNTVNAGSNITIDKTDPLAPIISSVQQTSAGILTRVYFTGEEETTTEDTFYKTDRDSTGTVPSVTQTVTNGDNQTTFFAQDFLSDPYLYQITLQGGNYTGHLDMEVSANAGNQRYEVELYVANDQGAPTPSGITGAPVGDLGVQVLAIGSTGEFDVEDDNQTNVPYAFSVGESIILTAGQRIRYHISATKVGTDGGNVVMSLYAGSNWLSFLDAPTSITTDGVVNTSTVTGATQTDVNDNLDGRITDNETDISGTAKLAVINEFTAINTFQHNVNVQRGNNNTGTGGDVWIGDGAGRGTGQLGGVGFLDVINTDGSDNIQTWRYNNTGVPTDNDIAKIVDTVSTVVSGEPVGSAVVPNMVTLTQAQYDAGTPNATTFYVING